MLEAHHKPHAPAAGAALRILMVAPQPFFRPRGTPFSVLHRIRALTALGHEVDLVTYPFGDDVAMPGLAILRSARVPLVKDVKIGPSFSKLLLDIPLFFRTLKALRSHRYDLVHSHEEAAFFCAPLARRYGLLHVYDMHSSLPQQLDNFQSFNFASVRKVFAALEHRVLSTCDGVITICRDLEKVALPHCDDKPHAMIENTGDDAKVFGDTKPGNAAAAVDFAGRRVVLYTGTFEAYQGLDLLLQAFALVRPQLAGVQLVLVGGRQHQVEHYRAKAQALGIALQTTFVGQVHPSQIPHYIDAAELIVSPRSSGTNTPLKIYGYLRSGRPIVATDLYTHTQTLSPQVAMLVAPTPDAMAAGILTVLNDGAYAHSLADAARRLSDAEYSDAAYLRKMTHFFRQIIERAGIGAARSAPSGDQRVRATSMNAATGIAPAPPAGDPRLDAVRHYWNEHVHDWKIARSPPGTREFFEETEAYRFEKLHYLPVLVDFGGFRGRRLLDVGCGLGNDLARFAQGGALVTGVDLAPRAIELAQGNFRQRGLHGTFQIMNGEALEFPDASFDVVYCHTVLHFTADPQRMIREIHRVLRPGGQAILMTVNRNSWLFLLQKLMNLEIDYPDAPVFRSFTIGEFRRMLSAFSTVRIVPERFPVATKVHRGLKARLFNALFVGGFNALPRSVTRSTGHHLMAFCGK